MEIKYKFANGEKQIVKVDVSEQMENEIKQHARQQHARNVMETRKHVSLNEDELGLCDNPIAYMLERCDLRDNLKVLRKALKDLTPDQIDLIQKVFFEGMTKIEYAEINKTTKQAINNRLNKIYAKLKKHF